MLKMLSGAALACAAAFLYALATLATRKLSAIPPAQIAGVQLLIGVAVLVPLAQIPGPGTPLASVLSLGTLGLIHTGLMYQLMYSAFQRLLMAKIAILSFIYPLTAILIDIAWFGTVLTPLPVGLAWRCFCWRSSPINATGGLSCRQRRGRRRSVTDIHLAHGRANAICQPPRFNTLRLDHTIGDSHADPDR
ncbi:DMT family transporter [Massilia sp. B-10]|nr:DMT family transporter [Massilia sp. B-10]